jgi:hypothetical protein
MKSMRVLAIMNDKPVGTRGLQDLAVRALPLEAAPCFRDDDVQSISHAHAKHVHVVVVVVGKS